MNILVLTIPVAITLAIFFVLAFLSAVKSDQFDDLETPGHLPFTDDEDEVNNSKRKQQEGSQEQ